MGFFIRSVQRFCIGILALVVLWFIVTQIYDRLDEQLPAYLALLLTYVISAYVLLPQLIHASVIIFRRGHIPRCTRVADGLLADPVNIVLLGTEQQLRAAFHAARWFEADNLTIRSMWEMARAFVWNTAYPTAPFSKRYLFGRKQDIGFQLPIGHSPRQRHHIRFWAANADELIDPMNARYWITKYAVDPSTALMWIGAASKDTGFGLARLTFQITHAVDHYIDDERDFIIASLREAGVIHSEHSFASGEFTIGKYVSDGHIVVSELR
ncbi:MAG: hypothetical protein JWM56_148 [Candidatus Peribacteria bacterium]|nr:hypothetical protein [Candidatus Peribacteria bacterium]